MFPTQLPSVTVLGSINIDLTRAVAALPAPGETTLSAPEFRYLGGKGANQAVAAARLGAAVRIVGAIGNDEEGDFAVASLHRAGVGTEYVVRVDARTGSAWVIVDDTGENQIVVTSGANALLDKGTPIPVSDILLCQLEVDPRLIDHAVAEYPGFVVINTAPACHLSMRTLERADLIVANELEYEALPELRNCRYVIVTKGGRGADLYHDGRLLTRVPAAQAQIVSTVGAGDAFTAAAAIGFAAGHDPAITMATAAAVGAHAVSTVESQPPLRPLSSYAPTSAVSDFMLK